MGSCTLADPRKKAPAVALYCTDAVPVSGADAVRISDLELDGEIDTLWALILPGACSTFPIFIMYRFFSKVSTDVIEAAKLDGANERQIFWRIGIPLGMPGIMSVIVLAFLEYWNLIEQPAVFLRSDRLKPLSLYLSTITKENAGVAFVAALIALLPPLLVFLCGRKYLEQGIAAIGGSE